MEQVVTLTAVVDDVVDGNDLQSFAPVARRAGNVQGPLFVFGGLDPDPAYNTSLDGYRPIVLPSESSDSPRPPVLPTIRVVEATQVDRLVLHNEDSPAADIGNLTSTRITGLGMAPDTYVAGRLFQGGVTYADLEALEIHLGYGADTFTVESTHAGTTLIDAGRGNDTVAVRGIAGHTTVLGREDDDTVRVSSTSRTLNSILAMLSVDGGAGVDRVYLDERLETADSWMRLTPTSVTGLGMGAGTDSVWTLRPGSAQVVTLVVTGVGFLRFWVGTPVTGLSELTAANLEAELQRLIFPRGMTYTGPTTPGHVVTEADYAPTGCGAYLTSDCAPSVWVQQLGDAFLIGFHGELKGSAAPALLAFDEGTGTADLARRGHGVEYAGLEVLDIITGSGLDVLNVQGTGATWRTDLHTGDGNDRFYVSSRADVPLTGAGSRPDHLLGDLSQFRGNLNIDAGTGRHTLMVSDEAGTVGRTAWITGDRTVARHPGRPHHLGRRAGRRRHLPRRARRPRDQLRARPRPAPSPTACGSGPVTATTCSRSPTPTTAVRQASAP